MDSLSGYEAGCMTRPPLHLNQKQGQQKKRKGLRTEEKEKKSVVFLIQKTGKRLAVKTSGARKSRMGSETLLLIIIRNFLPEEDIFHHSSNSELRSKDIVMKCKWGRGTHIKLVQIAIVYSQ